MGSKAALFLLLLSSHVTMCLYGSASAKALLRCKSNGFVMSHRPDGPHVCLGRKPNGLAASSTCSVLGKWGDSLRGVVLG